MIKKCILIIIIIFLAAGCVFAKTKAASLNATGFEWLSYSKEEKGTFVKLYYVIHGADKKKFPPEYIISALDDYYYSAIERAKRDPLAVDEDDFLKVRCVDVLGGSLK